MFSFSLGRVFSMLWFSQPTWIWPHPVKYFREFLKKQASAVMSEVCQAYMYLLDCQKASLGRPVLFCCVPRDGWESTLYTSSVILVRLGLTQQSSGKTAGFSLILEKIREQTYIAQLVTGTLSGASKYLSSHLNSILKLAFWKMRERMDLCQGQNHSGRLEKKVFVLDLICEKWEQMWLPLLACGAGLCTPLFELLVLFPSCSRTNLLWREVQMFVFWRRFSPPKGSFQRLVVVLLDWCCFCP